MTEVDLDKCQAVVCNQPPVAVVRVVISYNDTDHEYEYPYCADDLDFFVKKFKEYGKMEVKEVRYL